MQRIESRTYVGQANEPVTIDTKVDGGGQATIVVNGVDMGRQARFTFPPNPGDPIKWHVALMGPLGAICVVDTKEVDGAADSDFLICQTHNPAPVHFYTGTVAQVPAGRGVPATRAAGAKAAGRGRAAAPRGRKAAAKRAPAKPRGAKKSAAKKSAVRKTAARKTATRKSTSRRATARKATARKTTAKKRTRKGGRR